MFDGEQGGTGAGEPAGTQETTETRQSGGEKGDDKEALRRMGEQRDAARAEAKRIQDERDALLKEKQARDAAEAKAKEEAAAKRGEFEALATKREQERDEAKSEVARLKAENDRLREAISAGLEAQLKALPEKARKVLDATFGAEQVMERWAWLHKPEVQELITDKTEATRGFGEDPKATGEKRRPTAQQLADEMRARRGLPRVGVAS